MNVERIPHILRLRTIYVILPFWIVGILCLASPLSPHDLGHFIKSGDEILATRSVLSQDIFTYTFPGLQYVNSGWLSQVFMVLTYKLGGFPLLVLLKTFLLLLTMGIIYQLIMTLSRDYKISLLFILPVIALGLPNWNIRPQIFIIPIFAFFYSHLFRAQRINAFSLIVLPSLMLIWVNLHSSFAIGLLLVGIYFAAEVITVFWSNRSLGDVIKSRYIQYLLLLLVLLIAVTLINPYGFEVWKDMWANASASQARSTEWQATTMTDYQGYVFVASVVIAAAILNFSSRRVTLREALLLLPFLFLGFKAVRMIMWWGIVSSPILACHFCSIDAVKRYLSASHHSEKAESESLAANILLAVVIVITSILALPWMRSTWPVAKCRPFISPDSNPVKIVDFIYDQKLTGNMYNNLNWGSYFIWRLWPEYRVFGDNRLHLVPQDIWNDSQAVQLGYADWEKTLDKYDVSFAALGWDDNAKTIGYMKESPNWSLLYEDKVGTVFVRKPETNAPE